LTRDNLLIAEGYNGIVKTDEGEMYYEFEDSHIKKENIHIPARARWRVNSDKAFYVEYRSNCQRNVKLYHQLKLVSYADYKIGRWYISVYDVIYEVEGDIIEHKKENDVRDYF
jgi:hypothetical protein